MSDFSTDTTSDEEDRFEPNYYKTPKLIKPYKVPKRESDKDQLKIKFKKDKLFLDTHEVAITNLSEELVVNAITDAHTTLTSQLKLGVGPLPFQVQGDVWMTVGEFSQRKARQHLENFVSSWNLSKEWLCCIRFLDVKRKKYDDVYTYQVIWSIPTQVQPIPKATASVYFLFEVSLLKPRYYPVNVFFSFEYSRLVHQPGKTEIKEHMLRSIIASKLEIRNIITF